MTPRPGLLRGSKIKNYKGSNALRGTWSPPPGFSSRLSQMLDSRIDGEEMSDKFLLMYGRYNDENEQQHIK